MPPSTKSSGPSTSEYSDYGHPELQARINYLREFAIPLEQEVVSSSLFPLVSSIMNLPVSLEGKSPTKIAQYERDSIEYRRQVEELSYDYVKRLFAKSDPSDVFQILFESKKFERVLRSSIGKTIDIDGEQVEVTAAMVEALTKFRFSLGTPPVTPAGIEAIETIMFGGNLANVYAFRDLLGGNKNIFDRFMSTVSDMVEQSTHYTTGEEKRAFEKEAAEFSRFEGVRGFTKSIVTGTADTAQRLIADKLLKNHKDKPVNTTHSALDKNLIKAMTKDKESLFIVRVSEVPSKIFSTDVIKPEWKGIIGRLIIVNDSETAKKAGITLVYSALGCVKEALDKFHVKDSGTPANVQMNLYRLLEKFRLSDVEALHKSVEEKIGEYEEDGIHQKTAEEIREKEWLCSSQKDYLNLKNFARFLEFILRIKTGDKVALQELNEELMKSTREYSMSYFFSKLEGKGYEAIAVPQGGGRREIGIIGEYHLHKLEQEVDEFMDAGLLEALDERYDELKESRGIEDVADEANSRSKMQRLSPNSLIRNAQGAPGRLAQRVKTLSERALYSVASKAEGATGRMQDLIDWTTGLNPEGLVRAAASMLQEARGTSAAAKTYERGAYKAAANVVKGVKGISHRIATKFNDQPRELAKALRRSLEPESFDLAYRLINNLKDGVMHPSLALSEVGWTFNDVLDEKQYPRKNYLDIEMKEDGQLNPASLEAKLEDIEEQLIFFPELFELYCKSIMLIINDPHNPTSTVATERVKKKLLDVASKYGLTILADCAYQKQVSKGVKRLQGDDSLAAFYEENKSEFPNPIIIHTSLPTTKWAMGAGRRTGLIVTNDTDNGFVDFANERIDGCNTMSLYMDRATYKAGTKVKEICKQLEPLAKGRGNPYTKLDQILRVEGSNLSNEDFVPAVYYALIDARNELDKMTIRANSDLEIQQYISEVVDNLKNLRLDKRTARDCAKRSQAAQDAILRLSKKYPGLKKRCIKPQGPFYFCVHLDEGGKDPALTDFLLALARGRNVDVVPAAKGYVRFAFGGMLDGSDKAYDLLSLGIEINLDILLQYWEKFKDKRKELTAQKDHDPKNNALKQLFPGGEVDSAETYKEKSVLCKALQEYMSGPTSLTEGRQLAHSRSANVNDYISSIQPDSPAHIVTIRSVDCKDTKTFLSSTPFRKLFEHYLLEVKDSVPCLQGMSEKDIKKEYGAHRYTEIFGTRSFKDEAQKQKMAQVLLAVNAIWFSDSTIQILAADANEHELLGMEAKVSGFIKEFNKAFLTEEQEAQVGYRPTFQAAYQSISGLEADPTLPPWTQKLIQQSEFAGETVATNPSPNMITSGKARVAGGDRGIYKRDGEDGPDSEYFSSKLDNFMETMDPQEYVCKMVQVGGSKVMLVMNRAYSHYIVEELRLFPQFSISDDISAKPDAVSFLGIPSKVMGDDFKIGYFTDKQTDGTSLPVSWVNKEDITDYMGYLKKPILTVANEKVKEKGMAPIHGSAFTIVFKNGLRKTIVMGGDSGTGKSETIIAMVEQMMKREGNAGQIESIELLAGDMLSLFEGADGQLYMLGTEQGDFMRTTDISDYWQDRWRDLIDTGSKTNLSDPKNPRITVKGICDPEKNLRPVRVNMFFNINNFQVPPQGSSIQEVESQRNLIMQDYMNGYRGEKGTSGDQPNFYASILHSEQADKAELIRKHKKQLDKLLGWDVVLDERMKPANAVVKFNDIEGGVGKADTMVNDLFVGRTIPNYGEKKDKEGNVITEGREVKITSVRRKKNLYYAKIKTGRFGKTMEVPLDRENIFANLYNPIASTLAGQPFVDPEGMKETFAQLARVMKQAGVITGNVFTQLKIEGMEYAGPAQAAQDMLANILSDDRISDRYQGHIKVVNAALGKKYGTGIVTQTSTPVDVLAHNLQKYEFHDSHSVQAVDMHKPGVAAEDRAIDLRTPKYHFDPKIAGKKFKPQLLTPESFDIIHNIITDEENLLMNVDDINLGTSSDYKAIKAYDNKEELIYQILITWGVVQLGYQVGSLIQHQESVIKAGKIADAIMDGTIKLNQKK